MAGSSRQLSSSRPGDCSSWLLEPLLRSTPATLSSISRARAARFRQVPSGAARFRQVPSSGGITFSNIVIEVDYQRVETPLCVAKQERFPQAVFVDADTVWIEWDTKA